MPFLHNYFENAVRFMEETEIRYGAEFHFVPFALFSLLLPVNFLLLFLLDMETYMYFVFSQLGAGFVLGVVLSFFPGFKRLLIRNFGYYRPKKLGFLKSLKGYLWIVGIEVSPNGLVLLKLLWMILIGEIEG